MRPPPTKRAPVPSANSEVASLPPVFGSCFFFSAFFAAFFSAFFSAFFASAFRAGGGAGAGLGAGAGAALGAGAGAGAAFGAGAGAGAGAALGAAAADAACLTSCTHSVDPLGLVVMVEPFSSNSNSSVSELASIKSVTLCIAALAGGLYRSALVSVAPTARDLERLINFAALAFLLVLLLNLCEGRRGGNQHYR